MWVPSAAGVEDGAGRAAVFCDDVHSEFLINLINMPMVPKIIVTLMALWF